MTELEGMHLGISALLPRFAQITPYLTPGVFQAIDTLHDNTVVIHQINLDKSQQSIGFSQQTISQSNMENLRNRSQGISGDCGSIMLSDEAEIFHDAGKVVRVLNEAARLRAVEQRTWRPCTKSSLQRGASYST